MDFLCFCVLFIVLKTGPICDHLFDLALEIARAFSNLRLVVSLRDLWQVDLQISEQYRGWPTLSIQEQVSGCCF